jgi:hypothetical protein
MADQEAEVAMSEFTLEISGEGETITLEPVGVIDLAAANMLLEALSVLRRNAMAFLQIRLDRVTRFTEEALAALGAGDLPIPAAVNR